jgi:hypothetical protein
MIRKPKWGLRFSFFIKFLTPIMYNFNRTLYFSFTTLKVCTQRSFTPLYHLDLRIISIDVLKIINSQ